MVIILTSPSLPSVMSIISILPDLISAKSWSNLGPHPTTTEDPFIGSYCNSVYVHVFILA